MIADMTLTPGSVAPPPQAISGASRMGDPEVTLHHIRKAILADFERELVLCQKVAVMQACGFRHSEIARRLDTTPVELRNAEARVKRAAERLDHG